MNILVACEFSGIVRDAFIRKGHRAISVDLLESESSLGEHHVGDVFRYIATSGVDFDLMIAHPPCTYLANSGVRWLYKDGGKNEDRWKKMFSAAIFFKSLLEMNIERICIENPIQHKYATEVIGRRQDQVVQPWMFGHGETKATCFWLKGLPKLVPENIVEGREQRVHMLAPSELRWKERSRTYQGIAEAMANQWG